MRLKELRMIKGDSQKDTAYIVGVTRQAISLYEKGEREPNIATLIKLADYFDVSVDYLIGRKKTTNHCSDQPFG